MNLREEILKEHSKVQTLKIINWVGNDQIRFDELFELFVNDEYRVVQRAGWPLSDCVLKHPKLIEKHFDQLLESLRRPGSHIAVRRNIVRLLQVVKIPEQYQGEIMELCFGYIASPTEAVAVKAFSLTVLHNLSKTYPEILAEIKLLIEERWDHETAAFRSRASNILKQNSPNK